MADDSAVEISPVNRFFCHKCYREISILPDYTCPTCHSGFVEALEDSEDTDNEEEISGPLDVINGMLPPSIRQAMFNEQDDSRRSNVRGFRGGRSDGQIPVSLENLIQDFVLNFSGVGWGNSGSISVGRPGSGQVFLLGNPGDYVWGRESLDAIVTQLLNQMDTNGPPPLAMEKIDEIPSFSISQEQVDINLQCSVCLEDFKVDEQVRKLPCEHVYHENCIVQWLKLNGTCPICRKTLSEEECDDSESSTNPVGRTLAALFRVANETNRPSSTDASGTSNASSTSSRPDFNMDIDFD